MYDCRNCDSLMIDWGAERRWVLANENQMCIWTTPSSIPEVDIANAFSFSYFCCEKHALRALEEYLLLSGSIAQWSDVRPKEVCASCQRDFNTTTWHRVLVLSIEKGGLDESPELIDIRYAARYCNICVPIVAQPTFMHK